MLECLDIHAFKLIEDIHIDFKDGFSVITGETGAGKSIMLSALSLLSGAKGEASSIRNGFDSATVIGQFYINSNDKELVSFLEDNNIDYCDDTLIVKRIIKTNGRTLSYINNEAINRNLLMQLSTYLIDISAQHAHQSIMKSSKQLFLLDSYGENFEFLDEYKEAYQRVKDLENQKSEIENIINSSKQQEDYLKYAFEEINSVDPKENEDEELSDKIRRISQFEQIHDNISYIINILGNSYEGASTINNLENCNELLDKVGRKDDSLLPLASRIKSCTLEIEDIYETLKDYLENMQYSQVELDQMQSRLAQLQKIKKKYGPSLSSVIEFKNNIDSKLSALTNGEDDIIFIEKKLNKAKAELKEKAYALSARRKKSSLKLAASIERTLKKLGMKHASFAVDLKTKDFHLDGIDSVDFLMSANPGIEKRSIKEIASGGELSRVMLAIKTTLSEKDKVSILVFDEVDAGIGGEVATNVAQALLDLAATSQVIAITHLASIASKAHSHLMVKKYVEHDLSFTSIIELNDEERVSEIARMLSGDSNSKVSIEHAKALLD
jgi:DNA repair protein RecN (Recombination protein N)